MPRRWIVWSAALVVGIAGGVGIAEATQAPSEAAATIPRIPQINPRLDPGTRLSAVAPGFKLTDQFGNTISLRHFRGKVVVLSFNDPQCTTICPLTTTAMVDAKEMLGNSRHVALVGISANPDATQVKWVRAYSQAHGMMRKWRFLTGSPRQLRRVWSSYGIGAAVVQGAIDHTPATYIIDPNGRMTRLFLTNMAYSSVEQLAMELARAISADLPNHPRPSVRVSLAPISVIGPRQHTTLEKWNPYGQLRLGPGHGPRLLLFFNTWDDEMSNLRSELVRLNRYAALGSVAPLVAINEADVEPAGPLVVSSFLERIPALSYPVAVDRDGRVADGYGVEDSPWLTLVSGSGKILWRHDVTVKGWPTTAQLVSRVRAALAHARG
jgi:cytochrome oxidase Cu insertion factor (SCO1/SenC/PrrC family)